MFNFIFRNLNSPGKTLDDTNIKNHIMMHLSMFIGMIFNYFHYHKETCDCTNKNKYANTPAGN